MSDATPPAPASASAPAISQDPRLSFLVQYGPRLGVFAVVLGVAAGLLALRAHLKAAEASDVGVKLDRALALPEADLDQRIGVLRKLLQDYPGCDAEPWIRLSLNNQLYRKAGKAATKAEADVIWQEAYAGFLEVYERYHDHAAAPLALFSAGCAAEQLGRATDARRLYGNLKQDYPSTYLVDGPGEGSFQQFHTEGLNERVEQLRKAFPDGVIPPAPAQP